MDGVRAYTLRGYALLHNITRRAAYPVLSSDDDDSNAWKEIIPWYLVSPERSNLMLFFAMFII